MGAKVERDPGKVGIINPGDRFEGGRIIGLESIFWGVTIEDLGDYGHGMRIVFTASGDSDTGAARRYNAPFDKVVLVNGLSDAERELIRKRNNREEGGE